MSVHVLHIFSHGSYLYKKYNLLIYENKQQHLKKSIPIEDIKAIVIAAKGITLSDALIAALTSYKAIILHCNSKYIPVAWTTPLYQVIDAQTAASQMKLSSKFHDKLWQKILRNKIYNQRRVLQLLNLEYEYLSQQLDRKQKKHLNEAICARYYFRRFLGSLQYSAKRRDPKLKDFVNGALNYGYTVLASLCHRSAIVHGLNPAFGVHHKFRYRSLPLVYDIMEPLRAFIDRIYYDFEQKNNADMKEWTKYCIRCCHALQLKHKTGTFKFIEALDMYISSLARAFASKKISELWVPKLTNIKFE